MRRHHWALLALAALFIGFVALGSWQVQRRSWKLALIDRVERRVHAAPVAAPGPATWPHFVPADNEYRHVRVTGSYRHDRLVFVQAATELGSGYWVLTPLLASDGAVYLVNRGFVLPEQREATQAASGETSGVTTVDGLL
ncbi:hypothetical protein BH10PSE17_BH10PSE17_06340 [soil metagenome]